MRLLVISDIHGQVEMVHRVLSLKQQVDIIIIAGDITNFGGYNDAAKIIDPITAAGLPIAAVAGNCDTDEVENYLKDKRIGGSGYCIKYQNYRFIGVSGSLPGPSNTPGEHNDLFFECQLHNAADSDGGDSASNLVVITHQPAFGTTLDGVGGVHRGSPAVRNFIEICKPLLAISGHIHEAFGVDTLGSTTLVNPGALKQGRYAVVEMSHQGVNVRLDCLSPRTA